MIRLLRAEVQKLLTLPAAWAALLSIVGAGPLLARVQRGWLAGEATLAVLRTVPGYLTLPVLALGVLAASSEYSSSQALTTLLAAPRRGRLLLAKVLVVGVAAGVAAAAALVAGRLVLDAGAWTGAETGFVATAAAVLACLGVIAAGLTLAVRHVVGGLVGACSVILVAPVALASWPTVTRLLPDALGRSLYAGAAGAPDARTAAIALGCWVLAAALAGGLRLIGTDA